MNVTKIHTRHYFKNIINKIVRIAFTYVYTTQQLKLLCQYLAHTHKRYLFV
jgi:hypothetical protein